MRASNATSSRTETPAGRPASADSSSTTKRFTLSGPSADLDPRFDAFRPDLADHDLADRLFAPHYAAPVARIAGADGASLYLAADAGSQLLGTLDPGEGFELLDVTGGWAWGFRRSDHRVGYVPASSLVSSASLGD